MTIKLYDKDAYLKSFKAKVKSCELSGDAYEVILDKTAFFPEEGGQCADKGTLGGILVSDVKLKGDTVYHYVDKPLNIGEEVTGEIDWDVRYRNMQNHTGEHILSGLAHNLFGFENVGFHLGADEVTMDISGVLSDEQIDFLEHEANKIILQNKDIVCYYPKQNELLNLEYRSKLDLTENVRIVNIKDVDFCACCAPHVKSTAEVGVIKISYRMNWKGGMRFFIKCGFDAYKEYCSLKSNAVRISALLSAKQECISESVEKLKYENEMLKNEKARLENELVAIKIKNLSPSDKPFVMCFKNIGTDALREAVNLGMEKFPLFIGLLGKEKPFRYIIGSKEKDLGAIIKNINADLNGRGGGRGEMVQGSFDMPLEEIVSYFERSKF